VDLFFPMLVVGLVTSVHCVAMCGSMVLTYAVKDNTEGSFARRLVPHVAYQGSKILSYVIVGLALGAIGAAFDLGGVRGWVTAAAGLFMIFLGVQMTGKIPALRRFTLRPPKALVAALVRTRKRANDEMAEGQFNIATPITFGLLTGLMPCGPLQGAQLAAAATGSPISGAVAMLGFGLGTAPLMLGFGAVSGMLSAKFQKRMLLVAAVLVMGLGLVMLNRGAMLLGSPVTGQTIRAAVTGGTQTAASDAQYTEDSDGFVEVPLTISSVQFVPSTLQLPADKPVRLIVDRQEDNACSDQLAVPQLGVLANLEPFATTVVELPPAEEGSYTLTCGMGMMYGQIVAGGAGAVTASSGIGFSPLLLGVAGVVLLGLWWVSPRRTRRAEPTAPASGGVRAPKPQVSPQAAGSVLGFKPAEIVWIVAALAAAVFVGLAAGGLLTS